MTARRFSDLGISVTPDNLMGEKIKIAKVLGKEVLVKDFKLTDSKYEKTKHCLTIQVELNGEDKVIFTGSEMLRKQIEQIDKKDFPFLATIANINDTYQFQ